MNRRRFYNLTLLAAGLVSLGAQTVSADGPYYGGPRNRNRIPRGYLQRMPRNAINPRILGGTPVGNQDPVAASTVAIQIQMRGGTALCSGSLIEQDIIVTAAHCVSPNTSAMQIIFGQDINQAVAKVPVVGAIKNPIYRGLRSKGVDQGDIAVLRIAAPLPPGFHAAQPMPQGQALQSGQPVMLAGFGITDATTHAGAGVLRKVIVRIDQPKLGNTEVILDQTHGQGACHGDSGGPAFIQGPNGAPLLFGVTNRGYPDSAPDDCAHEAVYTNILAYTDFIQKSIAQLHGARN